MNESTQEPYVISVDWFQVNCKSHQSPLIEEGLMLTGTTIPDNGKQAIYRISNSKEFHPIFKSAFAVCLHGFQLATIFFAPRVSTLPANLCSIKVSNRLLYSANWAFWLVDIARSLSWSIENITRVDVCADFCHFANHLHPTEFISRYLAEGTPSETQPLYIRVGSNKYNTIGRRHAAKKDVCGSSENVLRNFSEYLRFGTRSTGCSVYLYNKSRELKEKHDKPYIVDMWMKNGLFSTDVPVSEWKEDESIPDVYRLELSINSSGLNVKRFKDSDSKNEVRRSIAMIARHIRPVVVERLSVDDFLSQQSIESIFFAYANKYFRFKQVGAQDYKHNWPDVQLFDAKLSPTLKPYTISRVLGTGISERNAARTIIRLLENVREMSLDEQVSLSKATEILQRYSHFNNSTLPQDVLQNYLSALRDGLSDEEMKRSSIVSVVHLEEIKRVINESIIHELRDLMTDSDVARAIAQYDAEMELAREYRSLVDEVQELDNLNNTH